MLLVARPTSNQACTDPIAQAFPLSLLKVVCLAADNILEPANVGPVVAVDLNGVEDAINTILKGVLPQPALNVAHIASEG